MRERHSIRTLWKSLKIRLIVLLLALGIVPGAVLMWIYLSLYESRSVESDISEIVSQGQALSNQIVSSGYLDQTGATLLDDQLESLGNSYSGRIMIVDRSLKIVKDTYQIDEGKTIVWTNIIEALQGRQSNHYDSENAYLVVAMPITANGEDEVRGALVVNKSMSYISDNQEYFYSIAVIYLLTMTAASLAIALIASSHFVKPFHKMGSAIEDVKNGIVEDVVVVDDYTEFAELSHKMNGLLNRMRVVDESRQEFVSNVSHELKTPLASMKVLADSLNGQEDVPTELYKEFMADIGEEIDRETKIINDLLSLVKMDKAAAALNISAVNMNELIELLMKRLKPIAEKQQIELVFESFRPVTAEIDEVKISLAITNLVENGIKYNEPGGWVHVSLNADHQYCYIKVEDTGMGIPEDSLDYIFERFYRVDKSHSREIGGTGLGLAITRSAIVMHKGAIKVHSVEGEGTIFDVRLPLNYIVEEVQ